MNPNECVLCVCVCEDFVIESKDLKLITVCLIKDYSLIADLHIFVYGRAELASISLECTKVKLPILINFALTHPTTNNKLSIENYINAKIRNS